MNKPNLQPVRGFRDLLPAEKQKQDYVFNSLKEVSSLYGFEPYDGPLLENIDIYLNKTSRDLVEKQTFQVKDKNDQIFILRPEMTPSLARMIANRAGELVFPLKLFNLGLRFRYEAPQKGREREFYQADFDIIGSNDILADAEILSVAVGIFTRFGATENDFIVYINSRIFMQEQLKKLGVAENALKQTLSIIDRKDKIPQQIFEELLANIPLSKNVISNISTFLETDISAESDTYFGKLFTLLESYGITKYCKINQNIVRGLDYYSGLVFEVKEKGDMKRSLLGGGRYDNLVATYNEKLDIPGVGFATSDVVLLEFLKDKNLLPASGMNLAKVLVTVFSEETAPASISLAQMLQKNNIQTFLYPSQEKKLEKQLKYADKKSIPYVAIIGAEEIEKNTVQLKTMKTGEQKEMKVEELIKFLISNYSN